LGDKEVSILGGYQTGSAQADQWLLLPFSTLQRLAGKPEQINEAYVVVKDAAKRSQTADELRGIVGDSATVQPLRK
jgi:hypothetical protein